MIFKPSSIMQMKVNSTSSRNFCSFVEKEYLPLIFTSLNSSYKDLPPKKSTDSLHVCIKDNILTTCLKTTCCSMFLNSFCSNTNATLVELLTNQGFKIIGKGVMDEFGMGSFNRNILPSNKNKIYFKNRINNKTYLSGGSSGGPCLSVYYNICQVAIGTDTGGSIRLPASFMGLYGFKPSYGKISRYGVVEYAHTLDTVGIVAKSITEIKKTFETISKHDKRDMTCLNNTNRGKLLEIFKNQLQSNIITVGYYDLRECMESEHIVNPEILEKYETFIKEMKKVKNIQTQKINSIYLNKKALAAYYTIALSEASSNLARYTGTTFGSIVNERSANYDEFYTRNRNRGFNEETKLRIMMGNYCLTQQRTPNNQTTLYEKAMKVRKLIQIELDTNLKYQNMLLGNISKKSPVDFIVLPTCPKFPPKHGANNVENEPHYDIFNVMFNLCGVPSISLPFYTSSTGEHIGMQMVAQFGNDENLLKIAEVLTAQIIQN